jgi:ribonuclease BN (tRNA processing enzyme)
MKTQPVSERGLPFSMGMSSNISLTNDGSLQVFCLGTGSMVSSRHGTTSFLVVKGDDHILIDCGPTVPYALDKFGVNLAHINCMHITHAHADHVGGMGKCLVHSRYMRGDRKKMTLLCDDWWSGILWKRSLSGDLLTHDYSEQNIAKNPHLDVPDLWYDVVVPSVISERISVFQWGNIRMETFRTAHVPAPATSWMDSAWTTGVLIDDKVWISGDTKFDPDILCLYEDRAQVFIHDTASGKSPVHASLDELSGLREELKAQMILTHYGDEWVKDEQPDEEARHLVKDRGFLGLAFTGMKIEFPPSL